MLIKMLINISVLSLDLNCTSFVKFDVTPKVVQRGAKFLSPQEAIMKISTVSARIFFLFRES